MIMKDKKNYRRHLRDLWESEYKVCKFNRENIRGASYLKIVGHIVYIRYLQLIEITAASAANQIIKRLVSDDRGNV